MPNRSTLLRRSFVLRSDDLGRKVLSGASFQFLGVGLRTVITIGSTAILARLLAPADFGYVAMATVITEFAALFSNFGFNALLIQRRAINRLQVDTVFWASVMLGVALAIGVFASSFFAGWLFSDPLVGEILRVLCLTFVIGSLPTIPDVVLGRLMRFQTTFWIQIVTVATRTAVAIAFAHAGFGVWSLVAGAITGALVQAALGFVAVPYRPRLRFHLPLLLSTWRTSGSYFGTGLLFYASTNVDLMMIGRQLGAAQLGYYQNARSFTHEIISRIAMPLHQVLFPAFSAIRADQERMQSVVTKSGRMLAAVVAPMGFGVSATAPDLVPVLYGSQWLAMIPVVAFFGISVAIKASTVIVTPIFNACDRVGLGLKYYSLGVALTIFGIWLTMPYGIEAVSASGLVVALYSLVPFRAALALIGLRVRHVGRILGPPLLASGGMWLSIAAFRTISSTLTSSSAVLLAMHVGLGVIVYVVLLIVVSRQYVQEFRDLALRLIRRA